MTTMRAKMILAEVNGQIHNFRAVCRSDGYGADGSDENNTFANWTPSANLSMSITNPALLGKLKAGDTFYVDFTPAE